MHSLVSLHIDLSDSGVTAITVALADTDLDVAVLLSERSQENKPAIVFPDIHVMRGCGRI